MKIENLSCEICQDLIPLVKDNIASKASKQAVYNHILNCKKCKELFDGDIDKIYENYDDTVFIKGIKIVMYIWLIILIILSALIALISSSLDIGLLISLVTLPFMGLIGYIFTGKYWLSIPLSAFCGYMINDFYVRYRDMYAGNYLPSINALLMGGVFFVITCLGVLIYWSVKNILLRSKTK